MSELIRYKLEFPINSSVSILYKRLSNASGLAEWFADDVVLKDKTYTFSWDGFTQTAKILKKKENQFIRYKWEESDKAEDYFEFLIQIDNITSDVALIITDFAENNIEKEEQTKLWEKQVQSLKRAIGS
ncbi:MAG: hypothetical protein CMD16_03015 [Flavobacteriales bacterium]|nr:hypothetical protein [Flavobacteriales bacterium]|tara:strand:+ start:1734 stop:2120 length:387 start_codon:yes stop_codon:yes gene_type:complete